MSIADRGEPIGTSVPWLRSPLRRYALAVLAVAGATVLQLGLRSLGPFHVAFILFYPTVVLVAMRAGLWPGMVATLLATVSGGYFLLEPVNSFVIRTPEDLVGPTLFAIIGVFLTLLTCSGKRAEQALRVSEDRYRDLIEHSEDLICTHDLAGNLISLNPAPARVLGYEVAELLQIPMREIIAPEFREQFDAYLARIKRTGADKGSLCVLTRSGERRIWEYNNTLRTEGVASPIVRGMAHDITERKRAEAALRASEADLNRAQAVAHIGSWRFDIQGNSVALSDEAYRIAGLPVGSPLTPEGIMATFCPEDHAQVREAWTAALAKGHFESESRILVGGVARWIHTKADIEFDGEKRPQRAVGTVQDITERKLAEERLRDSEQRYRTLFEKSIAGVARTTLAGEIVDCNEAWAHMLGFAEPGELRGRPVEERYARSGGRQAMLDSVRNAGGFLNQEVELLRKDGTVIWVLATGVLTEDESGPVILSNVVDITERKRAEEVQCRLNRELRAIGNCNQTLLRAVDEQTLLNDICRIVCDEAGYRMAWVGYAQHDEAKTVRPVAWAGVEDGYLTTANVSWADTERGHGPGGTAVRSGTTVCIQDFTTDPRGAPWRENASQRGYRSVLTVPLKDDNANTFGGIGIYSAEPNAFTPDEIRLLEQLADDLAFGIIVIRARVERKKAEKAIAALVQHVHADSSESFFNSMASQLAKCLEADCTIIAELVEGKENKARTIGVCDGGVIVENFTYDLAHTPSEAVIRQGACSYAAGVTEIFPKDPWLKQMEIEGYAGTPLRDSEGRVIGGMAALYRRPLANPKFAEMILQLFSTRTAAEIERKRAEEALRQREEDYKNFIARASEGIFRADLAVPVPVDMPGDEIISRIRRDSCVTECNDALAKMYGFASAQEMIGKRMADMLVPDDAGNLEMMREYVGDGFRVLEHPSYEVDRQGDTKVFLNSMIGVVENGKLMRTWGIQRDVTKRVKAEEAQRRAERGLVESEERFRVAIQNSPITVFCQDRDLRYTWIYNPHLLVPQAIIGKTDDEIIGADRARPLNEIKRRVLETGTGVREEVVIPHNGKSYSFDVTLEPLRDAAGSVAGITGASMDIARLRELADSLQKAKDRLVQEKRYLESEIQAELGFENIIGQSPALREVLKDARVVAPTDSTVLLLGETGTGKELVARAIHSLSARQDKNFIKLNCAAVPTGLLESELFGHEKGAFTSAVNQKIGRLELADKGTLFLDEIGELPLELQPKLLRVLQDREFERLGGVRTLRIDVRVISATNRDLRKHVAERKFREDLFYRLNVFPISMPALRERRSDIPALVHHFVEKYAARMGKRIDIVPDETMSVLENWSWPGNIRELENMIERMVILTQGETLAAPPMELDAPQELSRDDLKEMGREHIIRILHETNGVLSGEDGAASRLGIKRTTLQSMLKRFGIDPQEFRATGTFGRE